MKLYLLCETEPFDGLTIGKKYNDNTPYVLDHDFKLKRYNAISGHIHFAKVKDIKDIRDYEQLIMYNDQPIIHFDQHYDKLIKNYYIKNSKGQVVTSAPNTHLFDILADETQPYFLIIDDTTYQDIKLYSIVISDLREVMSTYPQYRHILINDELVDIFTCLKLIEPTTKEKFINELNKASRTKQVKHKLLKDIIELVDSKVYDITTSEQQIDQLLTIAKHQLDYELIETVSDQTIEEIMSRQVFDDVKTILTKHQLGYSATQQFNVCQQVGFFESDKPTNLLYNLSDMGSGKTLMTIETIYLLDRQLIDSVNHSQLSKTIIKYLPDKYLIAPTISIKSSWLKTFGMFYEIEEVEPRKYKLTLNGENGEYISYLHITKFNYTINRLSIDKPLLAPTHAAYIIMDEIHQLIQNPISRSRFFKLPFSFNDHFVFALSGTLSNLNIYQWLNWLDLTDTYKKLPGVNKNADYQIQDIRSGIANEINQDIKQLTGTSQALSEKEIKRYKLNKWKVNLLYKYADLNFADTCPELTQRSLETVNLNLFYEIVGSCAITTSSDQIMKDLFNTVPEQHTVLIHTEESLSQDELKCINQIKHISKKLPFYLQYQVMNQLINLGDGLSERTPFETFDRLLSAHHHYIDIFTSIDQSTLKALEQSKLIQPVRLEETKKFQQVKQLIKPEHTYLIVVNSIDNAIKLSEALNVQHLGRSNYLDKLNYQTLIDKHYKTHHVLVVPQDMVKSSLDITQADTLIQYQINIDLSDMIQTQNRLLRIGQNKVTTAYYIANDQLQSHLIEEFLKVYKNIRIAHRGITELFKDINQQITILDNVLDNALDQLITSA